ncbi:MAG: ABC transporter substrate-binding protein [Actinomycetota bacterium]
MNVLRARLAVLAAVAFILALALAACGGEATAPRSTGATSRAAFPVTVTDDDGISVTLPAPPRRIVTFAPSNTEIVFALGLGARLVGVSGKFDDYPPEAMNLEQVGGSGEFGVDPNAEKLVSLDPDLMLAISGGDEWKGRLRDLGIPVFTLNATDFPDLLHDIRSVGTLTGVPGRAAELTARMSSRAAELQAAVAGEPPVSCFFEVYYPPLTTVGPNTFIADLLTRAGCGSVSASARSDYPEWSVDELVKESPRVYLVASESGASPAAVAKRPGFRAIAAVEEGRIFLIDSDLVSRPGPRVVEGLAALAMTLHPEVFP